MFFTCYDYKKNLFKGDKKNRWEKLYYLEMNDVQGDPFLWVFFTFYDHKKNIFKGGKKNGWERSYYLETNDVQPPI